MYEYIVSLIGPKFHRGLHKCISSKFQIKIRSNIYLLFSIKSVKINTINTVSIELGGHEKFD